VTVIATAMVIAVLMAVSAMVLIDKKVIAIFLFFS